VLILNKKSISNQDNQIFKAELEKFRPHQNRILQANHKQTSILKELTRAYDTLLQDKRVRAEQSKYETFSRQRGSVLHKYRKVYQAFNDLVTGLMRAQGFYTEMKETVESLHKNVETFVNNRRSEGGQLLSGIEESKRHGSSSGLVDWERERLKELMDRMSMDPSNSSSSSPSKSSRPNYPSIGSQGSQPQYTSPPPSAGQQFPAYNRPGNVPPSSAANGTSRSEFTYQPASFGPVSPPINTAASQQQHTQQYQSQQPFSPQGSQPQYSQIFSPSQHQRQFQPQHQHSQSGGLSSSNAIAGGMALPPPPPGPPPSQDFNFGLAAAQSYPAGPGGYASQPLRQPQSSQQGQQQQGNDPWGGLSAWR
jgi:hypothetical protein